MVPNAGCGKLSRGILLRFLRFIQLALTLAKELVLRTEHRWWVDRDPLTTVAAAIPPKGKTPGLPL